MSPDERRALTDLSWPLAGERVLLRPPDASDPEGDLEATWRYWRDPAVTHWLPAAPADLEAHRARFLDPTPVPPTLIVELDGEVVGEAMLRVEDSWAQAEVAADARATHAEIGWVLAAEVHGRGLGTEVASLLLRIAFDALGMHRVSAVCFAGNTASWRLMEKLAMRREAHAQDDALHRTLGWCDSFTYALTRSEWRAG